MWACVNTWMREETKSGYGQRDKVCGLLVICEVEKCSCPAVMVLTPPGVTRVHGSLLNGEGMWGKVEGMYKTDTSNRKARRAFYSGSVCMRISDTDFGWQPRVEGGQVDKINVSMWRGGGWGGEGPTQDHEQGSWIVTGGLHKIADWSSNPTQARFSETRILNMDSSTWKITRSHQVINSIWKVFMSWADVTWAYIKNRKAS